MDGHSPELPTVKARQGETSGRMRWVLGISTTLVVIVFACILIGWF